MGKIRSDLHSHHQSSPDISESAQSLYALKGFVETAFGRQQQSIKLNFVRHYDESIIRIQQEKTTEWVKQNELRRLDQIQEYKNRWEKAQEIWLLLYLQQMGQNEAHKRALAEYLELMAKQEMLAKALFLLNLIDHLSLDIARIEKQIEILRNEREATQSQIVETITQLFMESLPDEIRNSPQANFVKGQFSDQYNNALNELKSSELTQQNVRDISNFISQTVLKEFNYDSQISSSQKILTEKVMTHPTLQQNVVKLQNDTNSMNQLLIEHQLKEKRLNDLKQQLAAISPDIQAQARAIHATTTAQPSAPKLEQEPQPQSKSEPKPELVTQQADSSSPTPTKNHDAHSTADIFAAFQNSGEVIKMDFSLDDDEPTPPAPQPAPPPETTSNLNKLEDKPKEDEPLPSFGVKPR